MSVVRSWEVSASRRFVMFYGKINRRQVSRPLYGGCPLLGGSVIRGFTVYHSCENWFILHMMQPCTKGWGWSTCRVREMLCILFVKCTSRFVYSQSILCGASVNVQYLWFLASCRNTVVGCWFFQILPCIVVYLQLNLHSKFGSEQPLPSVPHSTIYSILVVIESHAYKCGFHGNMHTA